MLGVGARGWGQGSEIFSWGRVELGARWLAPGTGARVWVGEQGLGLGAWAGSLFL